MTPALDATSEKVQAEPLWDAASGAGPERSLWDLNSYDGVQTGP
jgi:hypothetical protein